jgi:two-component system CheB/CheR fusion protein
MSKKIEAKKKVTRILRVAAAGKEKNLPVAVVGIGASAGGLEAIEKLFEAMPPQSGVAFVVIQHLSPDYKSIMGSLLAKHTKMHITEVRSGMRLEADHIYLNSPHKEVSLKGGKFVLEEPSLARGSRLPIDHFFNSLAADQQERAIGVVLSGTGSDGTAGIRSIKCAGGMVMVQEERQAKYDSMPHAAIGTGLVDRVLPVEKMAEELAGYVRHSYIGGSEKPAEKIETNELYQKAFRLIKSQTGHDFSGYKLNTIRRRIERRMAVHQIEELADYVRYMEENAGEVRTLFNDLLISVTSFFRDPEAWEVLQEKVLPGLLTKKPLDGTVRVWVPGCATGQEAYSMVMLLIEVKEKMRRRCVIQVFATDIDAEAIDKARAGVYPESITQDVSGARLKRFFVKEEHGFRIKKEIREMVVFAVQDVLRDAPFSKLDIVSCRNVLIYMGSALQKKVLPLFHYTLNPGGVLFLGTSETIGDSAGGFLATNAKWRIYERRPGFSRGTGYTVRSSAAPAQAGEGRPLSLRAAGGSSEIRTLAERMILQEYSLPCVLINDKHEILYFNGDTSKYLSQPPGEPTVNILDMGKGDLRGTLNVVIHKASQTKKPVTSKEILLSRQDEVSSLKITVRPLLQGAKGEPLMMVVFKEKTRQKPDGRKVRTRGHDIQTSVIEQELRSTKEYLQTTIEELETSNEELKSTNEELQSTNEELETVNTEFQNKIEELSHVNNDLSNLVSSTGIATIFLDNDLKIKRFTPTMKELFKLIETDIGRSIGDIVHNLRHESLLTDAEEVTKTLGRIEREVEAKDGRWFTMRMLPYRTAENAIDGVVMTFSGITAQKKAELAAMAAQSYAESIVETVRVPLVVLDGEMRIISANPAFYELCRMKADDTLGKPLYEIGQGQWNIPEVRRAMEKVLPRDRQFRDLKVNCQFAGTGQKSLVLHGRQVHGGGVGMDKILLAIEEAG